jgi:hypothetical protein
MLAGTILIPPAPEPYGPAKPGVRVKDLAIVIETRQTPGLRPKGPDGLGAEGCGC